MVLVTRRPLAVAALVAFSGFAASAQSVISTHSGVLHVTEGSVFTDNQPVNQKYGTFPDLKEKSVLRTEQGRAELLLTPGVFLRVGENSSVKMLDNRLSDTRVELVNGSAVVECDDPMKENAVTVVYKDYQVHVRKSSVLELTSDPSVLKVFHGEAEVELNGNIAIVKAGKAMPFTEALAQEKFDAKMSGDELTRWSQERSEAVAIANVSAAKTVRDLGGPYSLGLFSNGMSSYGSWYYNPFYSMYTYLPMNGMFYNAYGYGFFSPYTVYQLYNPGVYYGGGGSGSIGTPTASGNHVNTTIRPISRGGSNGFGNGGLGNNGLSRSNGLAPVSLGNSISPVSGSSSGFGGISPVSSSGGSSGAGRVSSRGK